MRTDIYSFHDNSNDFIIELHSSSSKVKKGGFADESKEKIDAVIKALLGSDPDKKAKIKRIVIDQSWKHLEVTDSSGKKIRQKVDQILKKPPSQTEKPQITDPFVLAKMGSQPAIPTASPAIKDEETPASIQEASSVILFASTDETSGVTPFKSSFIQRGFRPITPTEKLWKFFNNIGLAIKDIASKNSVCIGSYDFATYFFSKEGMGKQLTTKEVQTSSVLSTLADFFKDNNMATVDIDSMRKAADWAKAIEDLEPVSRKAVISGIENLARDIQKSVQRLKDEESLIIPFSSYEGKMGEKTESMRLLRLSRQKNQESYTLEFIDSSENDPIKDIPASSFTLEGFFKPLVEMQVPHSFSEAPEGLVNKVYKGLLRFAVNHPRLMGWALMGKSPKEERRAAVAILEHAIHEGEFSASRLAEKTSLTSEHLLEHVFKPLLRVGQDVNVSQQLFEPLPRIMGAKRMIDNFLPLMSKKEQVHIEATSLFQFFYLYQDCLTDDPASLAVLESGHKRVCELYLQLNIDPEANIEILRVIGSTIHNIKQRIQERTIHLDEKFSAPVLPDTFVIDARAQASSNKSEDSAVAPQPTLAPLASISEDSMHAERKAQDELNSPLIRKLDNIHSIFQELKTQKEILLQIPNFRWTSEAIAYITKQTQFNLIDLATVLKQCESALADKDRLASEIEQIAKEIGNQDLTEDELLTLETKYNKIINTLFEKINEHLLDTRDDNLDALFDTLMRMSDQLTLFRKHTKMPSINERELLNSTAELNSLLISSDLTREQRNTCLDALKKLPSVLNIKPKPSKAQSEALSNHIDEILRPIHEILEKEQAILEKEVKFPQSDELLSNIANQIALCKKTSREPLSPAERQLLQLQISEIIEQLPVADIDLVGSFWTKQQEWQNNVKELQSLLEIAYKGTKSDVKLPSFVLQTAVLWAISYRINHKDIDARIQTDKAYAKSFLSEMGKLVDDPYLRFNTPLEQNQLHEVQRVANSFKNKKIIEISGALDAYTKSPFPIAKRNILKKNDFNPAGLSKFPNLRLIKRSLAELDQNNTMFGATMQHGEHKEKSNARQCFDEKSCNLLDSYVTQGVKYPLGNIEGEIRQKNYRPFGLMNADIFYELVRTNSDDSEVGLEQILLQFASSEMAPLLQAMPDELRRVLDSRILKPMHLQKYFANPERIEAVFTALDLAIRRSKEQFPLAYITLVDLKATLVIFLKDKHKDDSTLYTKFSEQLNTLLEDVKTLLTSNSSEYKETKLQLHTLLLKEYAKASKTDKKFRDDPKDFLSLLPSWIACRSAASTTYTDLQEQNEINQFFFSKILPAWNGLDKKADELNKLLKEKGIVNEELTWDRAGEVYSATLPNGSSCQISIIAGIFTVGGSAINIGGGTLPPAVWENFPIKNPNYEPINAKQIPNTGTSKLIQFQVKNLGGTLFQTQITEDGNVSFSVKQKGIWYQYSPLVSSQDVKLEEKRTKEEEKTKEITAISSAITGPFRKMQASARAFGEELSKQMLSPPTDIALPKDIHERGIWIQKGTKTEAIVLNDTCEIVYEVKLAYTLDKNAKVKSITQSEAGIALYLVNTPQSSLYQHLTGLTKKENIKLWADSTGILQKIELLDPKMLFSRDSKTNRLMSQELDGFYLAENQNLPVDSFGSEWKNYLILTDGTEQRVIMRQSGILSENFLNEQGYMRGLSIGVDRKLRDEAPPFIEASLVEHPEKGFALQSNKAQTNLYLGLAALQCHDFTSAMQYLRAAARSAPYSAIEQELVNVLLEYKNSSFTFGLDKEALKAPAATGMADTATNMLTMVTKAMQSFELDLPTIAAAKLATLAALLEQDLSKQPELKDSLPKPEEIVKWLMAYHMPGIDGLPLRLQAVSSSCKLTPDELYRIHLHYPDIGTPLIALGVRFVELTGLPALQTKVTAPSKSADTPPEPLQPFTVAPVETSKKTPGLVNKISKKMEGEKRKGVVEQLASAKQTTEPEDVRTFQAGTYIISHFKEFYERIDALDTTIPEEKQELEKIVSKLSLFKDSDPGRKDAINFLRTVALQKYQKTTAPGEIQKKSQVVGQQIHVEKLKEHKDKAIKSAKKFIELAGGNDKYKRLDLIPDEEFTQLNTLMMDLENLTVDSTDNQKALQNLVGELSKKIRQLAANQRIVVRGDLDAISASIPYKGYRKQRFSAAEKKEVSAWAKGNYEPPLPKVANKIKVHATYTLADHFKDEDKYPLPEDYKKRLVDSIEYDYSLLRQKWKPDELRSLNQALRELRDENSWMLKVYPSNGFPIHRKDNFNPERMAAFLNSHKALFSDAPPSIAPEEATDLKEKKSEFDPLAAIKGIGFSPQEGDIDFRGLLLQLAFVAKSDEEVKKAYEAAKQKIQSGKTKSVGYYSEENLPFFDKLSSAQLREFALMCRESLIAKKDLQEIQDNIKGILQIMQGAGSLLPAAIEKIKIVAPAFFALKMLIGNEKLYMRPNAYELAKEFFAQAKKLTHPEGIASEADKLRIAISAKKAVGVKPVAATGTIQKLDQGNDIVTGQKAITGSASHADITACLETTKKLELEKKKEVLSVRRDILEIVNKLPEEQKAKETEELRRLSGNAVVIDIEKAFQLYAQDTMNSLKELNPSLTDGDIQKLEKLVTDHHIKASAHQILQRQLENIQMALEARTKFDKMDQAFLHQLNEGVTAFLDTQNKKNIQSLIDACEKKGQLAFAESIRDFMAELESFNKNATTKRFYDVTHDHPHTRAALAYEYTLGVIFRKDQIDEFTKRVGSPDIVSWLGTGFGKTFMAPGLAKMMATGANLVCVVDTKDLIPMTSKSRDQDSRAVYGQAAFHFQFERDPNRSVENLQEIEYRLLKCIDREEYIVTSKEALGSLVLQLLTWQRLGKGNNEFDQKIEVCQRIISLFKDRGVALGDEIHLILNVTEALDYAEGDRTPLTNYSEFYETTSSIYRTLYPYRGEVGYIDTSKRIAGMLKIAENRQAQVNTATIREATKLLAETIIKQSLDSTFTPKDPIHESISDLVTNKGVSKEDLVSFLTVSEEERDLTKCSQEILKLEESSKRGIAALKENLSNTFEKVLKKIADDDFGVGDDNLTICPYYKGRAQPTKELDDIFQTIQTHYMWYGINGIPVEGLKEQIKKWNNQISAELSDYDENVERCPTYNTYLQIFGNDAPYIRQIDDTAIEKLAQRAKDTPEVLHRFLEQVVFPKREIYPKKLGFNSMDLVSMFHKFGGYSGTIQTRSSFQRGVSNKDDPDVDSRAASNFRPIYENPMNQEQHTLLDLDNEAMKAIAKSENRSVPSLSSQLSQAKIDIKKFRAIIDVGGLFKELDFCDMAKNILAQFSEEELQAVLIYNDKSELVILRRGSDQLEPFDPKTTPPEPDMRFTVYRQPQITGSDIPQGLRAKALVTINEKTTWGDFEQGVGRMRKNKDGQTYAVTYRESLVSKIDEDLEIAKTKSASPAEVTRLKSLRKSDGKIDVKGLTGQVEDSEIKLRRYYAAIAEMENIVKQCVREQLCGPNWKAIFAVFENQLFEDGLKSADQLLEIQHPLEPILMLENHKKNLLNIIEKALSLDSIQSSPETRKALETAKIDLEKYTFPNKEKMPETVMGTAGEATKETEVSRETEVEAETEKAVEVERIQVEELLSPSFYNHRTLWVKWEPNNLLGLIDGNRMKPFSPSINNEEDKKVANFTYYLKNDAPNLLTMPEIDHERLFDGISITQNLTQSRHVAIEKGDKTDWEYKDHYLAYGQKICRSVAEISIKRDGKRIYHHLLLDVLDVKQFQEALGKIKEILTSEFLVQLKNLAKDQPEATLEQLVPGQILTQDQINYLQIFFGAEALLADISTVALRVNTYGQYTASCGALDIHYTDDATKELMVRSKIIRGELSFSREERGILENILFEDYLQVLDFQELRGQLAGDGLAHNAIEETIRSKEEKGIKDYSKMTKEERQDFEKKLLEVYKLYSVAVRETQKFHDISVKDSSFAKVVFGMCNKLVPKEEEIPLKK